MRIALLGTGKTGGRVIDVAGNHSVTGFNRSSPPTVSALRQHDAAISFLPGDAMVEHIPMLLESGLPLASGSTGMEWPEGTDSRLKEAGLRWITASNFAIGMNLVAAMIEIMSKAPELFDDYSFLLHEIHHIHKRDAPSGTALSWQRWLGLPVEFRDERIGDTVGDHRLTLQTGFESITIQHVAHDRKIFAKGAIWTVENLLNDSLPPGLHDLTTVMRKRLAMGR